MTKFYLIGGALFIGSLLSIEIMNVIDASKMQKLNDQMYAKYYEKNQKEHYSKMKEFCLAADPADLYLIDLKTLCEGYWGQLRYWPKSPVNFPGLALS